MPGHMSLMLSGALSGIRNIRHDYNLANGNGAPGNAGLKESLEDLTIKSELQMSLVSFMSLSLHFKEECRIFYCAGLCTAASLPFYEDISAPRVSCNTEPGRGQ